MNYFIYMLICLTFFCSVDPTKENGSKELSLGRVIVQDSRGIVFCGDIVHRTDTTITILTAANESTTLQIEELSQLIDLGHEVDKATGAVYLHDGRVIRGVIVKNELEEVILSLHGIHISFAGDDVNTVIPDRPFEQVYVELLERLDLDNEKHLESLILWLLKRDKPKIAEAHLQATTSTHPTINRLQMTVRARLGTKTTTPQSKDTNQISHEVASRVLGKLLSDEEVNLIRVYEIDLNDPPALVISPQTRQRFINLYGSNPIFPPDIRKKICTLSDLEVFKLMRALNAKELYDEVFVVEEPRSLANFRQYVHDTWLVNRCGTLMCHGGYDSGRFLIRTEPRYKASSRYANLLMLDRLVVDTRWPLLNYENPERSLIIQYALPRNEALKPHPETPLWEPAMRLQRNNSYDSTIRWIKSMRQLPRPNYPIEFPVEMPEDHS